MKHEKNVAKLEVNVVSKIEWFASSKGNTKTVVYGDTMVKIVVLYSKHFY